MIISETPEGLQNLLDIITQWCNDWRVTVYIDKTKVLHFRNPPKKSCEHLFKFNGMTIDKCEEYKYLGITLNYSLSMNRAVDKLHKAGSHALSSIVSKLKDNKDLGFQSYSKLYESMVVPILDYAVGAWGLNSMRCKQLDYVQHRAMRFYCGTPRTTPICGIEGDFGWCPGPVQRDLASIRLYNSLSKIASSRVAHKLYNLDKRNAYRGSWYLNLKEICDNINMSESLEINELINIKVASDRLMNLYKDEWDITTMQMSKLKVYRIVKSEWGPGAHLKVNMSRFKRSLVSHLLYGVLALEVENGHFEKTPHESRICKLCKKSVEDEIHFLFKCDLLRENRLTLYRNQPNLLSTSSNIEKLKQLADRPYVLGNYIDNLWKTRTRVCNNSS